jgi:hypothetical protein
LDRRPKYVRDGPKFFQGTRCLLISFFLTSEMASFASWLEGVMAEVRENQEMEGPREVRSVPLVSSCEKKKTRNRSIIIRCCCSGRCSR